VRARFGLGPFVGSLFVHALCVEGHDVVKYALDLYGDDAGELSCTHDANAWPARYYAGLPAPADGERVSLWIQNSHPTPIPAGAVGLREMGAEHFSRLDCEIPPFATHALDVSSLLPRLRWPRQIEIDAGRHFVRPRYEIVRKNGARRIAHANVERSDLRTDPAIAKLGPVFGKGFILPAPVLPIERYRTCVLPTPMALEQHELPVRILVYDASGREVARESLGRLPRRHDSVVDVGAILDAAGATLESGYGHVELAYDFDSGVEADGWLHGLFRYERRDGAHAAETSFGAHLYNLPVVFNDEPQSYSGPPPGLSTRLFLRLGFGGRDVFCHLVYAASAIWHDQSSTELQLFDGMGRQIAVRRVRIPRSGSLMWRYHETFDAVERRKAGDSAHVIVRDATCRLFGYHGLVGANGAFSLDHMFGF
jgi:hypothetical protein